MISCYSYDSSSSSASYEVAKSAYGVYNRGYGYNNGYNKGYGLYNRGYNGYNKGYGLYNRGYGYGRRVAAKKVVASGSYSVEYTNKYGQAKSASHSYEVTRTVPAYNRGYGYGRRTAGYGYGRRATGYGYNRKSCK